MAAERFVGAERFRTAEGGPSAEGITVSELNLMVAEAIRRDPRTRSVTVRGEISGFKHYPASGHWYFSLKDENASVNCVMFRQNNVRARIRPKDGDSVVVGGYIDVFPKNGQYQLYAMSLRPAGVGDLFLRLEELKHRLNAEGLFDTRRKKMLPMLPRKVAVVTSQSGAALHDILNVSAQRNPTIPIVLIPVTVQGNTAAGEIARGLKKANALPGIDVIIVARGGGSQEDLWCFNEEIVARAVAESRIPVVSGVGHEIDTTLCDLAADVRASTPSNAAEIVFPNRTELRERIHVIRLGLSRSLEMTLRNAVLRLRETEKRLSLLSPEHRVARLSERNTLLEGALNQAMRGRLEREAVNLRLACTALTGATQKRQREAEVQVEKCAERLKAISPLAVLERGYALVYAEENRLIHSAREAEEVQELNLQFADGRIGVKRKERETG